MDPKFTELFNLAKKDEKLTLFAGDDLHMGSMAPYGISSGLPQLDLQLGRKGGLPASKVVEYYGAQFCGKTTAALQAAAEWQKRGGLVVFIDTEKSFDITRARELGVNVENVFKHEADTIEQVFDTLIKYVGEIDISSGKRKSKTGILDEFKEPVLFIVDSITGVPSNADVQGDINESDRPGFEAKQIKRGLKKVNPILSQLDCKPTIIFINHSYSKFVQYGKNTESSGGRGIKYYASVRVEFVHAANEKDEDEKRLGQKISIEIEKLKGGHLEYPKFKALLTNARGFDRYESLKEAMILTTYARKPKSAQVITILPDTDKEEQVRTSDFQMWVDQKGYDEAYLSWRNWCIQNNVLLPWGTA